MAIKDDFSTMDGVCFCCGDVTRVMAPSRRPVLSTSHYIGVCDPCAYVLGHAWRRELGQLVRATSPRVARTYVLVARLPLGKVETDIGAYELLVEADGGLPHHDSAAPRRLCAWLADAHGCVTWEPLFRQCYLGYAASGDFSEVLLARAWGRAPGDRRKMRFVPFGELLAKPTPDAGFYLGVKAAFEGLLWRVEAQTREVQPDDASLFTLMREPAMRYLEARLAEQPDEVDASMLEMYRTAMTADELEVARVVGEAVKRPAAPPPAAPQVLGKTGEEATDVPGLFDGTEEEASPEDLEGEVAAGFARPRRPLP